MEPGLTILPALAGDAGTAQTLTAMRAFVDSTKFDPIIRGAVLDALGDVPARDEPGELRALLEWVQTHVRFTRDPLDGELLHSPVRLVEDIRAVGRAAGDCDDMATLFAALAEAAGYPTRFVVGGPDQGDFAHVYAEAFAGGRWYPADPSAARQLGWAPVWTGGRRATEMRGVGRLGENGMMETGWPYDPTAPTTGTYGGVPGGGIAQSPTDTETSFSFDWLGDLIQNVAQAAPTVLPILERYDVLTPAAPVAPSGAARLPTGGYAGATWQTLSQPGPLGLPMSSWLLLGGAAVLVVFLAGKR